MRYCGVFRVFCEEYNNCSECAMNIAKKMRYDKLRYAFNGFIKEANTKFKTIKLNEEY